MKRASPAQASGGGGALAIFLILNSAILFMAVWGTLTSFLSGAGLALRAGALLAGLLPFLLLTILCNSVKKLKFLSLLPFLIAMGSAVLLRQDIADGIRLLLHALSEQMELLGYAGWYALPADAAAWENAGALETALRALFRLFGAAAGYFIFRRSSAAGLLFIELPLFTMTLFCAEAMEVWPFLIVAIACLALYILSSNRTARIVESDVVSDAGSEIAREEQIRAALLPKQRRLSLLSIPLLLAVTVIAAGLLPRQGYERPRSVERLRQTLTQSGMMRSLLDLNDGLQRGRIDRLEDIVLTGDTAIRIRVSEEQRLYLRGYAGAVYTNKGWDMPDKKTYAAYSDAFSPLHPLNLRAALFAMQNGDIAPLTISIARENAGSRSLWLTNGLVSPPSALKGARLPSDAFAELRPLRQLWEYGIEAYPIANTASDVPLGDPNAENRIREGYALATRDALSGLGEDAYAEMYQVGAEDLKTVAAAYTDYVYAVYTVLPEDTALAAAALCAQYDLSLAISGDGRHIDVNATCDRLRGVLSRCSFTQTPAAIEKGADFTTCFLNTTREGYCAHFATAAAVLLRSLGIPTRYAEGYLVTSSDYDKERDAEGYLPIEDTHAHAWVEIYDAAALEWIPFEMIPGVSGAASGASGAPEGNESPEPQNGMETPEAEPTPEPTPEAAPAGGEAEASPTPPERTPETDGADGEAEPEETDGGTEPGGETVPPESEPDGGADESHGGEGPSVNAAIWLIPAALLLMALALFCGRYIPLRVRRRRLRKKNMNEAVLYGCDHMYAVLKYLGAEACTAFDTPAGYAQRLHDQFAWLPADVPAPVLQLAEQARFAGYRCTKRDQLLMQRQLRALLSVCAANVPPMRRLILWYRYAI